MLTESALRQTGYFDPAAVRHWRSAFKKMKRHSMARTSLEMGLVGVTATQLWHHIYIDPSLCELPGTGRTRRPDPIWV